MKQLFIYNFIISLFFIACKNDKPGETVTPIHNASLYVTVLRDSAGIAKPLSGVTVYLYLTDNDRTNNQNVKYSGTVTDSGKISFTKLPDDYYYLLASHPTYGTNKSETATPNNSTSYEEIDY